MLSISLNWFPECKHLRKKYLKNFKTDVSSFSLQDRYDVIKILNSLEPILKRKVCTI